MQTDMLLKLLMSSLEDLKKSIDGFEKKTSPQMTHAEQLYTSLSESHKLIAAFLVLKQQQDLSPDLNLHLKLMSVPVIEEKPIEAVPTSEIMQENNSVQDSSEKITASISKLEDANSNSKEANKITVNINDKFRFINELFKANANEYNIAIEQLNAANTIDEINSYLLGLKSIYEWKEENEMAKKLFAISHKRFS